MRRTYQTLEDLLFEWLELRDRLQDAWPPALDPERAALSPWIPPTSAPEPLAGMVDRLVELDALMERVLYLCGPRAFRVWLARRSTGETWSGLASRLPESRTWLYERGDAVCARVDRTVSEVAYERGVRVVALPTYRSDAA